MKERFNKVPDRTLVRRELPDGSFVLVPYHQLSKKKKIEHERRVGMAGSVASLADEKQKRDDKTGSAKKETLTQPSGKKGVDKNPSPQKSESKSGEDFIVIVPGKQNRTLGGQYAKGSYKIDDEQSEEIGTEQVPKVVAEEAIEGERIERQRSRFNFWFNSVGFAAIAIGIGNMVLKHDERQDRIDEARSKLSVTQVAAKVEENDRVDMVTSRLTLPGNNERMTAKDNGFQEVYRPDLLPDENKKITSEESEGVLGKMLDGAQKWFSGFTKSDETVKKLEVPPETKTVEKKPMPLEWHLAQKEGKIVDLEEVLKGEFQSSLDYFKTAEGAKDLNAAYENLMNKDLHLITKPFTDIGVPSSLVYALLVQESRARNVTSDQGASGWFQITPYPGRYYGLRIDGEVDERNDVYKSAVAAAKLLADELVAFNGDIDLALHAYNRGRTLGVGDEVTSYDVEDRNIDIYYDAVTGKLNKRLKNIQPTVIKSYTVKPGDTIGKIAGELGSSVSMIVDTNQIPDPNKIYPGAVFEAPTYFNVRNELRHTLEGPFYVTLIKAAEKALEEAGHLTALEEKRKADELKHQTRRA